MFKNVQFSRRISLEKPTQPPNFPKKNNVCNVFIYTYLYIHIYIYFKDFQFSKVGAMKIKQNYSSLYLISPSINIVNTKKHREIIGLEYTPRLVSHSPIHEHIVYIYIRMYLYIYIYNIYTSIGGTRVPSFSELTHRSSSSRLCLDTKSASNTSTSRYIRYIDCERTQKIYLA